MSDDDLRGRLRKLGDLGAAGERAPYQPLLLLYVRPLPERRRAPDPVRRDDERLPAIFRGFGPSRRSYHPEYPFWYLRRDLIWQVAAGGRLELRAGKARQPTKWSLLAADPRGG